MVGRSADDGSGIDGLLEGGVEGPASHGGDDVTDEPAIIAKARSIVTASPSCRISASIACPC